MSYLLAHPARVAHLTAQHVTLVAFALLVALAIALPLGIYAARRARGSGAVLGALSVLYTIPSLALFALLIRYLGLGFWTTEIVLVAYAQFVLVRNIAAALRGVPAAPVDAARGLGMTPVQQFWRVELPLATPVMLAGVRVAAVAMIALATLGAYAGSGGLGVLIFEGLDRQYPAQTLAGSIPAAFLAIVADTFLRALERAVTRYTR